MAVASVHGTPSVNTDESFENRIFTTFDATID